MNELDYLADYSDGMHALIETKEKLLIDRNRIELINDHPKRGKMRNDVWEIYLISYENGIH